MQYGVMRCVRPPHSVSSALMEHLVVEKKKVENQRHEVVAAVDVKLKIKK